MLFKEIIAVYIDSEDYTKLINTKGRVINY
jgi:hypothetical protein